MSEILVLVLVLGATTTIAATIVIGVYVILGKIGGVELIVRNGLQLRMTNVERRLDWLVDVAYKAALRDPAAHPSQPPIKLTEADTAEIEEVSP